MNLHLEDLKDMTDEEVREHIRSEYETDSKEVERFDILIAYESVGNWGCDSSSFFLLKDRKTGQLYENNGSHCSCFGFEGQWKPEETTIEYLKSDKFYFYTGGYDGDEEGNKQKILDYVKALE